MPADRRELRRHLFHQAAQQGGYFTAAQAKNLGYSYQAQAHHVASGNWRRVDRGLFRLNEWVPELHDDLIRWILWSKNRAIVSHETAMSVYGIGEFESARIHLVVPPEFTMDNEAVIIHRATLPAQDIQGHSGFKATSPVRTLIDVAAASPDEHQLARAIQDATREGLLTLRQLRSRAETVSLRGALNIERATRHEQHDEV